MVPVARAAIGVLVVVLGIVAACGRAQATASARLIYLRGPGTQDCAGAEAIHDAVRERLGYDPFLTQARDTLSVAIQRRGHQFQTEVRLLDGDNVERGARRLSVATGDCASLIEALGLTISLTIDPGRVAVGPSASAAAPPEAAAAPSEAAAPPPEAAAALEPEATAAPPRAETEPPALSIARPTSTSTSTPPSPAPVAPPAGARPRPARAWSARAGVVAVAALSGAPAPTGGMVLFAGFASGVLSLDVELRGDAPATGDSDTPPTRVRSWLVAGFLVPCVHLGPGFACPVVGAGEMGASARSVAAPADRRGPWSAAGGRIGVEWPLSSRLTLHAHAELLGNLTRNRLEVDAVPVYRVPSLSASLGAGLACRFP